MNLLLDTHSLFWFFVGDRQLSPRARRAIEFGRNRILVSVISGYELASKSYRGKLQFPLGRDLLAEIRRSNFTIVPMTFEHAVAAGELGGPHGDPWDRILIAQARLENLTVVTRDEIFQEYGVRTLW